MAKSKKGKCKEYKEPDEKFLVVVNPPADSKHQNFINNICAWFEFMLEDDYVCASELIRAIYTQSTHTNIIVELEGKVDIESYIGAHVHRLFLNDAYCRTDADDGISTLYEYNFKTQNHPSLRSWTARIPDPSKYNLEALKTNIFRGAHYPPPLPARAPSCFKVPYAKCPKVVTEVTAQAPGNTEPANTTPPSPSVPPPALLMAEVKESKPMITVKKRDPYEEDDDALQFLKSESHSLIPTLKRESELSDGAIKEEPIDLPVKREVEDFSLSDAINEYLNSIQAEEESRGNSLLPSRSSPIKAGLRDAEIPTVEENDLFAHLSAAIAEYESARTSSEPVKTEEQTDHPDRVRSTTLLTNLGDEGSSNILVKPEPEDIDALPPSQPIQRTSDLRRARSTTLQSNRVEMDVIVKQEPQEVSTTRAWPLAPNTIARSQSPVSTQNHIGHADSAVRDPRLARRGRDSEINRGVSRTTVGERRMYNGSERPTPSTSDDVTVKLEPQDDFVSLRRPQSQTLDPRPQKRSGLAGRLGDEIEGGKFKRVKTEN